MKSTVMVIEDDADIYVILLDLMMPVMDGWAFRRAQRTAPALASIPVVLVSAHVDIQSVAREMEVAAWLRKPIDFRELLQVVERPTAGPTARPLPDM